jgi:excisionase family DNA binding protein
LYSLFPLFSLRIVTIGDDHRQQRKVIDMNSDILTTLEAAQYVRLGKPTLDKARVTGGGPRYAKLGGAVRYRRADLDDWLASRIVASTSANHS